MRKSGGSHVINNKHHPSNHGIPHKHLIHTTREAKPVPKQYLCQLGSTRVNILTAPDMWVSPMICYDGVSDSDSSHICYVHNRKIMIMTTLMTINPLTTY